MSKSLTGTVSSKANLIGSISTGGFQSVSRAEIEGVVIDTLIAFGLAPIVLDSDGAVLVDYDDAILVNM